ncbi:hypothetical protein GE061_007065 [Apolygus lucorum]|uniref:Uncharacterized protein n=1 Tax=Apolygus lucorum TaxID=248454 RepID=A0A8S9WQ44_APOLU|nr:hypothetical protein GE061_007065 [Apolygus lucorum]
MNLIVYIHAQSRCSWAIRADGRISGAPRKWGGGVGARGGAWGGRKKWTPPPEPRPNESKTAVTTEPDMKLRERLTLGASFLAVLVTLGIVLDLQLDLGMTGHRLLPRHGRVRYGSDVDPPRASYNSFRRKFLERSNSSASGAGSQPLVDPTTASSSARPDQFLDLREVLLDLGNQDVVVKTYEADEPNPNLDQLLQLHSRCEVRRESYIPPPQVIYTSKSLKHDKHQNTTGATAPSQVTVVESVPDG